jgi:hypothetical protein
MKRFALFTGLLAAALGTANGQGTIACANSSSSLITNYRTGAPVVVGTTFKVALYYLPDLGVTPGVYDLFWEPFPGWPGWEQLGASVNIAPVPGRFNTGTRTTPWLTWPGTEAYFQVRVWETAFGATFEEAINRPIGGRWAMTWASDVMKVATGNPFSIPQGLPGFASPNQFYPLVVPEPSALSLAVVGATLLLLMWGLRGCSALPTNRQRVDPRASENGVGIRCARDLNPNSPDTVTGIVVLAGLLAASLCPANGQGTIVCLNNGTSLITNHLTRAPLDVGTAFKVALYYLPDAGVTPETFGGIWQGDPGWTELGAPVNISPVPGRFTVGIRTTPNSTPAGGAAWFQARVWEAAFGATFDEAWRNSTPIDGRLSLGWVSDVMKVATGSPAATPPGTPGIAFPKVFYPLVPGQSQPVVPEPSAVGLGLLGAALGLLRRRKSCSGLSVVHRQADADASRHGAGVGCARDLDSSASSSMKRIGLLVGVLIAPSWTATAQGTINFGNNVNSLVLIAPACPVPVGTMFKASLYYLPDSGTPPSSDDFTVRGTALGPSVGFAPLPGHIHGGTRSTPGTTWPGGDAWFQVRVWETAFGSTYAEAWNNSTPIGGRLAILGYSNIIRVTTGDPSTTPAGVPGSLADAGLRGFWMWHTCIIPEPSAVGLGLLGVALWPLLRRHRGSCRALSHDPAIGRHRCLQTWRAGVSCARDSDSPLPAA